MNHLDFLTGRNHAIRARIIQLLPLLEPKDQRKFLKKLRSESSEQAAHTFRELVLGAFLLTSGFNARYEVLIDKKTPDWLLYDSGGNVIAVVDQLTYHQKPEIDQEMNMALQNSSPASWWIPDNTERLYQKIYGKAETYEKLVDHHGASSIVAVFGESNAAVEIDELEDCLYKSHGGGVFKSASWLSGVIYFQEAAGSYEFSFFGNSSNCRKIFIPGGRL